MYIDNATVPFFLIIMSTHGRLERSTKNRQGGANMSDLRLGVIESRFADMIWEKEPVSTAELVKRAGGEFAWKRTTTYTVLKRLCERGIFRLEDSVVTSLISRDDFYAMQSEKFVSENFGGSLPAFFAAFTARKGISSEELQEIRRMIDSYGED